MDIFILLYLYSKLEMDKFHFMPQFILTLGNNYVTIICWNNKINQCLRYKNDSKFLLNSIRMLDYFVMIQLHYNNYFIMLILGTSLSTGSPTPLSSNHLTTYILQKLLSATNTKPAATLDLLNSATVSERSSSSVYGQEQRKAAEERIFSDESGASIVYGQPAVQQKLHEIPIKRYLDEAKEQIDVIDFTQPVK